MEMMDTLFTIAFLAAVLVVPAILVLTVRRFGVLIGVAACWLLPLCVMWFGREFLDHPDSVGGGLWLLIGWVYGLIWCTIVWAVKHRVICVVAAVKRRKHEKTPTPTVPSKARGRASLVP